MIQREINFLLKENNNMIKNRNIKKRQVKICVIHKNSPCNYSTKSLSTKQICTYMSLTL
jgi:hypothetical protein